MGQAVKERILNLLAPLFEKAESENLVFYTSYQGLRFTPIELKAHIAEGRYMWPPSEWTLIPADDLAGSISAETTTSLGPLIVDEEGPVTDKTFEEIRKFNSKRTPVKSDEPLPTE